MIGEALLHHLSCFGELSSEDAEAVRGIRGEARSYARDNEMLRHGDQPSHSIIVLDGMAYRYRSLSDGNRQIFGMYFAAEAPSLETLHIHTMDHTLAALVDCTVGLISHQELNDLMAAHPRVLALIWRQTLVQSAIFRTWLLRNSSQLAHAAMAHLFCEMLLRAQAAGLADGDSCPLPVTQEVLSDVLGISMVHVSRTLQILRQTGAVEFRGGTLHVLDRDRLWALADFEPDYLHFRPGVVS